MAVSPIERLRVIYEVNDAEFIAGLKRMQNGATSTNESIAKSAKRAENGIAASTKGMIAQVGKLRLAMLALAASTAGVVTQFTDPFKQLETQLKSIGQASDEATNKLLAAAIRARGSVTDMAATVARVQKATGDGYDLTVRRVETLQKAMSMAGAATSEVNSVVVQLGQALQSGVLQGDEFRSLRENAPIEVMQALAKAANTSIGGLKELASEGKLTTEVVLKALDSLALDIDTKFSKTTLTVAQGWSQMVSGATVFFGRLDEGLGATDALAQGFSRMAQWLAANVDMAEEIGRAISIALGMAVDGWDALNAATDGWANTIAMLSNPLAAFTMDWEKVGEVSSTVINGTIEMIAKLVGVLEGASNVLVEAFLKVGDAVRIGVETAINAMIGVVEAGINKILDAVRVLASMIDQVTGAASSLGISGTNLAGGIGSVELGRVDLKGSSRTSDRSLGEAYNDGYASGHARVGEAVDWVAGVATGITEEYQRRKRAMERQEAADRKDQEGGPTTPVKPDSPTVGDKAGGKGKKTKEKDGPEKVLAEDLKDLERQAQLIGLNTEKAAALTAEWKALDAAKAAGVTVTDALLAKIREQAAEVGKGTAALERQKTAAERVDAAIEGMAGAMADAITDGASLREGLASVFRGIANDFIKSGLTDLFKNLLGGATAGGGGGIWSFIGGIFGGQRAGGGSVMAGQPYVVGERKPELFVPQQNGTIFNQDQLGKALAPASASGGSQQVQVEALPSKWFELHIRQVAKQEASSSSSKVIRSLPSQIKKAQQHPRLRGGS